MEERVHTNGDSNGSNGEGSVRTVRSQPGTSQQASSMNMKTWCTEHGKSMAECFYEHHKPIDLRRLLLPCGHLCMRPEGYTVVKCKCGRTWVLQMDNGGAWEAREQ